MKGKKGNFKPVFISLILSLYLVIFLGACALLGGMLLRACTPEKPPSQGGTDTVTTDTQSTTDASNSEQMTDPLPIDPPENYLYGYDDAFEQIVQDSYLQKITFQAQHVCGSVSPTGSSYDINMSINRGSVSTDSTWYNSISFNVPYHPTFPEYWQQLPPNTYALLERIQQTAACCLIETYSDDDNTKIAVYPIDGLFYFLSISQDEVVKIHVADIQYDKSDQLDISGISKHLILEITDYMEEQWGFVNPAPTSFSIKLNHIKYYNAHPLLVKFDAENYYFVCAYYNPTHEDPEYESFAFCCVQEYTWVKYDRPEQIAETYNGMRLISAYQVNRAVDCRDIGPAGGITENVEHYTPYTPEFSDGVNVWPAVVFDQSYIYLNSASLETAYFTTEREYSDGYTFPCVELDGQFYVPYKLYTVRSDGTRVDNYMLEEEFDTYYDQVMRVMIMDQYSEYNELNDYTVYYGLISLPDLQDMILE